MAEYIVHSTRVNVASLGDANACQEGDAAHENGDRHNQQALFDSSVSLENNRLKISHGLRIPDTLVPIS